MGAVFLSPFSCATASRGRARSWLIAFLKSLICVDGKPYKTSAVENAELLSVPNIAKTRDPGVLESLFLCHGVERTCAELVDGLVDVGLSNTAEFGLSLDPVEEKN